jgi:hypothetical protein
MPLRQSACFCTALNVAKAVKSWGAGAQYRALGKNKSCKVVSRQRGTR